jgi:hypothetical protein
MSTLSEKIDDYLIKYWEAKKAKTPILEYNTMFQKELCQ